MSNDDDKTRGCMPTAVKVAIVTGVFGLMAALSPIYLQHMLDKRQPTSVTTPTVTQALLASEHGPALPAANAPSAIEAVPEPKNTATVAVVRQSVPPKSPNELDLSGTWKAQFVGISSAGKEYLDYTFKLSQAGKIISGQASVGDPANPLCTYGFILRGEVPDANPLLVQILEIGYVAPLSCTLYSAAGYYKDYDLTYESSAGNERLIGQWTYGQTTGKIEFVKQP